MACNTTKWPKLWFHDGQKRQHLNLFNSFQFINIDCIKSHHMSKFKRKTVKIESVISQKTTKSLQTYDIDPTIWDSCSQCLSAGIVPFFHPLRAAIFIVSRRGIRRFIFYFFSPTIMIMSPRCVTCALVFTSMITR